MGGVMAAKTLPEFQIAATMDRILLYAGITNDFNPLHVDPDFARQTPMGGPIAHGTMSLNLLMQSVQHLAAGRQDPLEVNVRFIRPVRVDETIVSGGQRRDGEPGAYDVWVRNGDGESVIEGVISFSRPE